MQLPALDFGKDSGVIRWFCDGEGCHNPLGIRPDGGATFAYRGRAGDYCSRACLLRSDAGREKVKLAESGTESQRVKAEVGTIHSRKVKTRRGKGPRSRKVKPLSESSPAIDCRWRWNRSHRRGEVARIRGEILERQGREPTIAAIREQLSRIGLSASIRTIWLDLQAVRSGKSKNRKSRPHPHAT